MWVFDGNGFAMACLAVADSVLAALGPAAHIDVAAVGVKIATPAALRQG
jgi:hypothetical protein